MGELENYPPGNGSHISPWEKRKNHRLKSDHFLGGYVSFEEGNTLNPKTDMENFTLQMEFSFRICLFTVDF